MTKKKRRSPFRAALTWVRRIVLVALLLAVLAIGAVLAALHTDWGREKLRAEIEAQLASRVPGGAKVGRVEGSVLGTLIVRDVELDARDGRPMVTVGALRVQLALPALLEAVARVDAIEADDVVVAIRPQPPAPPEPPEPEPSGPSTAARAWRVELPRIDVHDATVSVQLASGDVVELTHVQLGASFVMPRRHPMEAKVGVRATWRDRQLAAVALAQYGGGELAVPFASLAGGGVVASAIDVHVAPDDLAGVVTARVSAKTIAELAGIEVPGDIALVADADGERVGLDASSGDSRVYARGSVDVGKREWRGIATVTSKDLGPPTHGLVTGHGTVAIAARVTPQSATGVVGVLGAVVDPAESGIELALDATRDRAEIVAALQRGTSASGSIVGEVTRKNGEITVTRGRLLVVGHDVEGSRGTIYVDADVRGPVSPRPALTIDADIDAERASYGAVAAAGVQAHLTAYQVPTATSGHVRVTATGLHSGALAFPRAVIESNVSVGSDGTVIVDDIAHEIRTAVGTWSGTGGRVTFTPRLASLATTTPARIDVRGVKTNTAGSAITVTTGTFSLDTGDLAASVTAQNVAVAAAVPDAPGTIDGTISVARRGGAWSGKLHVDAHGVGRADVPADATVDIGVGGRRVAITAHATNPQIGDAALTAQLDGPRDLADVAAWLRLDRRAVREAELDVRADVAPLALGVTGIARGSISIADGEVRGDIHADGIHVAHETAVVDVDIGPGGGDELAATIAANLSNAVQPHVLARVALPQHVFDPAAWKAVDRHALRGAVVKLDDTKLDAGALLALGLDTPYSAHASATIDVGEGGEGALVDATLSQVAGGQVVRPLDVHVTGAIDGDGAHGEIAVSDGPRALVTATAQSPLTMADAFEHALARAAPVAAITGTVETPDLAASDLLAIVGRKDVTAGLLHAKVSVVGTTIAPTGTATISARGVVLQPPLAGREAPTMQDLDVVASWGGAAGELTVTAHEVSGGQMRAHATGRPDELAKVEADFDATDFDVAPLAAFAPGTLSALTGTIALATVHYDPRGGKLIGHAHLAGASVPLSAQLGTFREAKIDFEIAGDKVDATLDGKLGQGTAHGTATIALAGALPASVDGKLALRQVSPLGSLRPKVDANITAKLARHADTGNWSGDVHVDDASARVSLKFADELYAIGAPDDMVFVDAPPKLAKAIKIDIPQPSAPWLDVTIAIAPATFEATEPGSHAALGGILGVVHGTIEGNLELSYGDDGIGLQGQLVADRGDVELVGRRYDVEVAELDFDGPIYPKVNVQISHVFPDLTLDVGVTGRLPTDVDVEPSSDNSQYTPDQLYGILFGGDPGGDPANAAQDAATAAGAAVASSIGGRYVNQGLARAHVPIKFDVLRYTAATGTSSASFEVGKWLFGKLYLAYRQHLEALPTENINEGVLQYYFERHILLDTSVGDREYDSADVLYRLRW